MSEHTAIHDQRCGKRVQRRRPACLLRGSCQYRIARGYYSVFPFFLQYFLIIISLLFLTKSLFVCGKHLETSRQTENFITAVGRLTMGIGAYGYKESKLWKIGCLCGNM
jgi:hypothetical protein